MTEEERNLDLIIGDLQKENRLLKARVDQLEKRDLTDEDITKLWESSSPYYDQYDFARLVIEKLKDA